MSLQPLIIHATPPLSSLPASDPQSLYLAALLQLSSPGRWAITQGDWTSNGGRLPYMTHLKHDIRLDQLFNLPGFEDPDTSLTAEEKADSTIWRAYIEQNLTDLVNHSLYSLPPNYPEITAKSQLTGLNIPGKLYIPQRVRGIHKARLEHVGLWGMGGLNAGDAVDEDRRRLEESFIVGPAGTTAPRAWSGWRAGKQAEDRKRKFGEEELTRRIKSALDPLARRLGNKDYFFGDRPSTLDLVLVSHLALILESQLPNPFFANIIHSTYPPLLSHYHLTLSHLFPHSSSTSPWTSIPRVTVQPEPSSSTSVLDSVTSWWSGKDTKSKSKKDRDFERGRWMWFAGAAVAVVTYVFASGLVQIQIEEIDLDEDEDEDDDDDEEDEEDEEDGEGEEEEVQVVIEQEPIA